MRGDLYDQPGRLARAAPGMPTVGGNPRAGAVVRRVQRFRLRHLAQTRLWLVPLTCVLAGIGLAVALLSVDRPLVGTSVTGSAASVQTILTLASTALVPLTSVL